MGCGEGGEVREGRGCECGEGGGGVVDEGYVDEIVDWHSRHM